MLLILCVPSKIETFFKWKKIIPVFLWKKDYCFVQTESNFLLWICFLIIHLVLPLEVHWSFIGLFDCMIWVTEFVHRIKREGHTYSSLYGCEVFQVWFAKPTCTFLQWYNWSTKQNRRHENESRKTERIESEQIKSRAKRKWMRGKHKRKRNSKSVQNCH